MKSIIKHLSTHKLYHLLVFILITLFLLFTSCTVNSETIRNTKQSQQTVELSSIHSDTTTPIPSTTPINISIDYTGVEKAFEGNWCGGNK